MLTGHCVIIMFSLCNLQTGRSVMPPGVLAQFLFGGSLVGLPSVLLSSLSCSFL